jgi:pyruvate formate lyase activating enzyme
MESGIIFDIRKFSLHDGPGIRTAVFLKGCSLSCPWCHNPEGRDPSPSVLRRADRCVGCRSCAAACPLGIDPRAEAGSDRCASCPEFGACARACPAEALQEVGIRLTVSEVMEAVRQDRAFYDETGGGVTFTGGEPLAQPGFLIELLEACAAQRISAAVETSGHAATPVVLDVARRTDLLLFDLKTADPALGSALTGGEYSLCLKNLEAAARARVLDPATAEIVVRMPIVPGQNDGTRDIEAAADFVSRLALQAGGAARPGSRHLSVCLLPYHDLAWGKHRLWGLEYPLGETSAPDAAALEVMIGIFAARGVPARIGG